MCYHLQSLQLLDSISMKMYEVAQFNTASLCCASSMPMSLTTILVQDWSALAGRHGHHWRSTLMPALWAVRVLRHWCSFRFAHQVFLFQIFLTFYIFLQFESSFIMFMFLCLQHRFLLRSAEILLFVLCKFYRIPVLVRFQDCLEGLNC